MKLEYLSRIDELYSKRFEDDQEIMGACASGIITPITTVLALNNTLNTKSHRSKYMGTHSTMHESILKEILKTDTISESQFYRVIRISQSLICESTGWIRKTIYQCPKFLTPYEMRELEKEINVLLKKNVKIGGIVYNVDPRVIEENLILKDRNNSKEYEIRRNRRYRRDD